MNLLVLRAATANLLHAKLVVVTPTVRSQFGSRLSSVFAPSVLARFGSGADLVTVQVTAPDGPSAYNAALSRDVADRRWLGPTCWPTEGSSCRGSENPASRRAGRFPYPDASPHARGDPSCPGPRLR